MRHPFLNHHKRNVRRKPKTLLPKPAPPPTPVAEAPLQIPASMKTYEDKYRWCWETLIRKGATKSLPPDEFHDLYRDRDPKTGCFTHKGVRPDNCRALDDRGNLPLWGGR